MNQISHGSQGHSDTAAHPVRVTAAFMCAFAAVCLPATAYAAPDTPMAEVLCYVLDLIQGNAGKAMAAIGVMTMGAAAIMGKASWGMALTVGVGIAVIFGAVNIVDVLGLGLAECPAA